MPRGGGLGGGIYFSPALWLSDRDRVPGPGLDYLVPFFPSVPSPSSAALCSPPGRVSFSLPIFPSQHPQG